MPSKKSAAVSTPGPAILKKAGSASGQKTLLGFFSKTPSTAPSTQRSLPERSSPRKNLNNKFAAPARASQLTPQPSSDAIAPEDDEIPAPVTVQASCSAAAKVGLPSPVSADEAQVNGAEDDEQPAFGQNTPSRKAKKKINYVESDDSDDDVFKPKPRARVRDEKRRPSKRRKVSESADEDEYEQDEDVADDDDGKISLPGWGHSTHSRQTSTTSLFLTTPMTT